ncbi:hypothetical protein PENSPDRAFT_50783 [Peniophora sp. CONT]|nr:hypothetical protein PENSPDRAFT_50783 [Peniophora sp. CONT]
MQTSFLHVATLLAAILFIFPAHAVPVGREVMPGLNTRPNKHRSLTDPAGGVMPPNEPGTIQASAGGGVGIVAAWPFPKDYERAARGHDDDTGHHGGVPDDAAGVRIAEFQTKVSLSPTIKRQLASGDLGSLANVGSLAGTIKGLFGRGHSIEDSATALAHAVPVGRDVTPEVKHSADPRSCGDPVCLAWGRADSTAAAFARGVHLADLQRQGGPGIARRLSLDSINPSGPLADLLNAFDP